MVIPDRSGGALAGDPGHRYEVPALPDTTPVYERTGADDAFAATVVAGLVAGLTLEQALRRAPVNAMSAKHEIGAQAGLLREDRLTGDLQETSSDFAVQVLVP